VSARVVEKGARIVREEEKSFVGKITASVTHELMNVFATIRETSGLMEDLLALSRDASFPHAQRFAKSLGTIRDQVSRGMEISGRFNQFAHNMDEVRGRAGVNELLQQVAFLMHRAANLKRVQLAVQPGESPVALSTDLFRLQMVLVACIECGLAHATGGTTITLQSERSGNSVVIRVLLDAGSCPASPGGELPEQLAGLRDTVSALDASLSVVKEPRSGGLELILPLGS
jgi:C4-dicarboxylate-specific signal transduction histidine kinase